MEHANVSGKVIVVDEEGDRASVFLQEILRLCGRVSWRLFRAEEPLPDGVLPAVYLACRQQGAPISAGRPTLVTDFDFASGFDPAFYGQKITYSMEQNGADFTMRNIRKTAEGFPAFEIVGIGIIGRVRLASREECDARAALAASAAAIGAGIPFADALEALNHLNPGVCGT